MLNSMTDARLYGILDAGYVPESKMESVAQELLDGGVGVLQLRAKGYEEAEVLRLLKEVTPHLLSMCQKAKVPLIINDFARVAAEIGANGVHIGQDDGSLKEARAIVGDSMIVGRSTHSVQQALDARDEGFDYIGFGPLFPTPTKKGRPGIGMENIALVQKEVGERIPVFCIGGIKPENLPEVLEAGARRVVIVSSLLQASDITEATRSVVDTLQSNLSHFNS